MADRRGAVRETFDMVEPVTPHARSAAAAPPTARDRAWSTATVALVATPGSARAAIPFLSVLGLGRHVVSWQQLRATGARPDAYVATRVELLPGLTGAPVAVFVNDRPSLRAAARRDVEVALTSDQRLLDHGAVLVPRSGVDVARWRIRTPDERAAERTRLGLPDVLAVAVDHARISDDVVAALSLASAAVVTGPMVPLALALGTPVVTSPVSAERLGLHPDLEVEVVAGARRADLAARDLAADRARAEELSRRGRRFAEHHLDLGHPAELVAARLGLGPVEGMPAIDPVDIPTAPVPVVPPGPYDFTWPETGPVPTVDPDPAVDASPPDERTEPALAGGPVLRPTTIDLAARGRRTVP